MKKIFIILTIFFSSILFANNENLIRITPIFSTKTMLSPHEHGMEIDGTVEIGADLKYSNEKLKFNFNKDNYLALYVGGGIRENYIYTRDKLSTQINLLTELEYKIYKDFFTYTSANLKIGLAHTLIKNILIGSFISFSIDTGIKYKNFRLGAFYSNDIITEIREWHYSRSSMGVGIIIGYDFDVLKF